MEINIREYSNGFVCFTAKASLRQPYIPDEEHHDFCSVHYPYSAPYLFLVLWYRPGVKSELLHEYDLSINVMDDDDFDAEKMYTVDESDVRQKTHELLNWMKDNEMREIECWEVFQDDFYPEIE